MALQNLERIECAHDLFKGLLAPERAEATHDVRLDRCGQGFPGGVLAAPVQERSVPALLERVLSFPKVIFAISLISLTLVTGWSLRLFGFLESEASPDAPSVD